jgi:acyl carrier protein
MDQRAILVRLQDICRGTFENPNLCLTSATTAIDVDGWDSLSHVRLMLDVERAFQIKVSVKDVMKLANVGELVQLIQKKAA